MKYVMDPCYRAIAPLVPAGAFAVDLGSGLGMLPVLLGVLGDGRRALGIEWDARRSNAACTPRASCPTSASSRATRAPPSCRRATSSRSSTCCTTGTPSAQRALLARCRAALRPGGRLLVREGDPSRRGGARWTRAVEAVVTRLGWNRGPQVRFRPVDELRADLEALGFRVRIDEVAARTHPGNVLLVCDAT